MLIPVHVMLIDHLRIRLDICFVCCDRLAWAQGCIVVLHAAGTPLETYLRARGALRTSACPLSPSTTSRQVGFKTSVKPGPVRKTSDGSGLEVAHPSNMVDEQLLHAVSAQCLITVNAQCTAV